MSQLLLGPIGAQHWQLHKELSKHTLQHNLYSKRKCKYSSKPQQAFCPSWNHFIFDDEIMHKDWVLYFADSCSPKEFFRCMFLLLRGDMSLVQFTEPGMILKHQKITRIYCLHLCKQTIIYIFRTKDQHSMLWFSSVTLPLHLLKKEKRNARNNWNTRCGCQDDGYAADKKTSLFWSCGATELLILHLPSSSPECWAGLCSAWSAIKLFFAFHIIRPKRRETQTSHIRIWINAGTLGFSNPTLSPSLYNPYRIYFIWWFKPWAHPNLY